MVAASAGNHAQGVALAASLVGTSATVYMPVGASIAKLTATRAYGAHVELVGQTLDESLEAALEPSPPAPARCWCTRSTIWTCCSARARSGWRSPSRFRTWPPWWSPRVAVG